MGCQTSDGGWTSDGASNSQHAYFSSGSDLTILLAGVESHKKKMIINYRMENGHVHLTGGEAEC